MQHVAPPYELLARMVTLRVHLDEVSAENSLLLIAPGSHAVGQVPVEDYAEVVERFGTFACLAGIGDVNFDPACFRGGECDSASVGFADRLFG
ncbi:MAG: hypothetical protein AB7E05_08790 [Sphingobium sp.]